MKHILVVDDERCNLELVKHILELEGMSVQLAESGEEAMVKLRNGSFDLMITDLNMPGLNGLELAWKALETMPQMPVIMISGDITPEIPHLAAEAGIIKIFAKPFRPDELLEAVRELVGNKKIVTTLFAK